MSYYPNPVGSGGLGPVNWAGYDVNSPARAYFNNPETHLKMLMQEEALRGQQQRNARSQNLFDILVRGGQWGGGYSPTAMGVQSPNLVSNLFNSSSFSGGAYGPGFGVDFGQVQGLLNDARSRRESTYSDGSLGRMDLNYGQGDLNYAKGQLKDLSKGASGKQMGALREQGMSRINQSYMSSLRDMQGMNNAGLPKATQQSRMADLLKQRISARKGLERDLITDDLSRRSQVLGQFSDVVGADYLRRLQGQQLNSQNISSELAGRLGNPEMAAQLNLQGQQSTLNARTEMARLEAQQRQNQLAAFMQLLGGIQ